MFYTGHNTQINENQIPDAILDYYNKKKEISSLISIIIGTDSQNFNRTKMVSVICVIAEGHGGIFFYQIHHDPLITDVRQKLYKETNTSLNIATSLVNTLENDDKYQELYLNCPISIHIDAGNSSKGKTKQLIPELVGWIKACGYQAAVKPDSFAASSVADKLSK